LLHQPTTSWGLLTFTSARSLVVNFLGSICISAVLRADPPWLTGDMHLMTEGAPPRAGRRAGSTHSRVIGISTRLVERA
jgi:hypothetical protein